MSIYLGNDKLGSIYIGSDKIGEIYIGSVKVYSSTPVAGVVIGGKRYPTCIMPDGHEWLACNLDFTWSGLTVATDNAGVIGSRAGSSAAYYNFDEATYGWSGNKYGLLYNGNAVKAMAANQATLFPGWHVPTDDECWPLFGNMNTTKLKAVGEWGNYPATDDYGFHLLPAGVLNSQTGTSAVAFTGVGTTGQWFAPGSVDYLYSVTASSTSVNSYQSSSTNSPYTSLRLVKDY